MKEIQLTRGMVTVVDDEDYEVLAEYKWFARESKRTFYAARDTPIGNGKQTLVQMHREIMGATPGQEVDHWDGDGLHNWRKNLRYCTHSQNSANRHRKQPCCSSRYKGVTWSKGNRKWRAQIKFHAQHIHLGYFTLEEDAARAYNAAALEHFSEFACLNEIEMKEQL